MDQDGACSLARDAKTLANRIGAEATNHGCVLTDQADPSVSELVLEAMRVHLSREDLHRAS
jgi:uncharacterized protein (DUF2345 family)